MDPQELVPLEAGVPLPRRPTRAFRLNARFCYHTPLRLCRLLAPLVLIPSMLLLGPLYLRYRVYSGQMYPMSMTDMRLIDGKISPTWCQRQVVKSNATFNAFVVPGPPEFTSELVSVSMTRELELEDDMKEYWGFYLLKGSSVTVSACVRWPGASLIMIKGYKHLHECAYIGDNSSEELDELLEANKLGLLSNSTLLEKLEQLKKVDGKANDPGTMKRHKAGVSFHDPIHSSNVTSSDSMPAVDVTDHDPKELREILERLHAIRQAAKTESLKYYHPPSHLMSLPALHRHRDTNVDRDERRWLSFKDIDGNNSNQKLFASTLIEKTTENLNKGVTVPNVQDEKAKEENLNADKIENIKQQQVDLEHTFKNIAELENGFTDENNRDNDKSYDIKEKVNTDANIDTKMDDTNIDIKVTIKDIEANETQSTHEEIIQEPNSKEVFEDVLRRLKALGDRGKRVLVKLQKTMDLEEQRPTSPSKHSSNKPDDTTAITGSAEELDRLRQILVEAIDEEKTRIQRQQKRRDAREQSRAKRELMLGQIELQQILNTDDEARDYAAEEDLEPDGYADHHQQLNETTAFDMSNSEFWSSFSSSEEALLECEGLVLNLPLTPHSLCRADASAEESLHAAKANALTYRVPANGYYFFVFNSENEVQRNFIRARFDLQKTRYEVARTTLRECRNKTDRCDLPLDFFSSQKVILEVPLRDNDSLWNEQFVILSECEPRTSIYIACVIAVPVLIMVFAFQ